MELTLLKCRQIFGCATLLLLSLLLPAASVRGQGRITVSGTVVDENDLPVIGANVLVYIKEITENPGNAKYIPMKCADPKVSGGLSNNLRYRFIDLSFMLSYQFGGYSYDNWAQKTEHGGDDLEANIPTYYRNRWKKPGDHAKYERFIADNDIAMSDYANSRRLHPTDFIRLKNLTVGLTVPEKWTRKIGIDRVRAYASGNNLLTWAKHDYYDPEAVSGGTAIWGTPPLKTMTFGLEVNF